MLLVAHHRFQGLYISIYLFIYIYVYVYLSHALAHTCECLILVVSWHLVVLLEDISARFWCYTVGGCFAQCRGLNWDWLIGSWTQKQHLFFLRPTSSWQAVVGCFHIVQRLANKHFPASHLQFLQLAVVRPLRLFSWWLDIRQAYTLSSKRQSMQGGVRGKETDQYVLGAHKLQHLFIFTFHNQDFLFT